MSDVSSNDGRTVSLDMDHLYQEAVELVGETEAIRLWEENRLDSKEKWPGKWATAMEIIERLRGEMSDQ